MLIFIEISVRYYVHILSSVTFNITHEVFILHYEHFASCIHVSKGESQVVQLMNLILIFQS